MSHPVNDQVAAAHPVLRQTWADAAQHRTDAGRELTHGEGFDHVIVRPGVQAANPIGLLPTGGEHDDRHVAALRALAEPTTNLNAGNLGQHPVQHDQIGQTFRHQGERLFAVSGHDDVVALLVEIVLQQGRERVFVLDHENMRDHLNLPLGGQGRRASVLGREAEIISSPVIS